jgi:hypothetical protein
MSYVAVALAGLVLAMLAMSVALSHRHRRLVPRLPARPPAQALHRELQRMSDSGRYRGVSIEAHCAASHALAGREYGFTEAPRLPVEGCDAPVCPCTYIGLVERRSGGDRRGEHDRRRVLRAGATDRRSGHGRRKTDQPGRDRRQVQ